jgi:hypothetical protein
MEGPERIPETGVKVSSTRCGVEMLNRLDEVYVCLAS